MNAMQKFDFKGNDVRTLTDDKGDLWFVAADVCKALGIKNSTMAVKDINPLRKAKQSLGLPGSAPICITKAGLYDLLFQSRKPQAVAFKDWVTGTVLPAIDETGGYIMGEENCETDDELALRALKMFQNKVDKLQKEREALAQRNITLDKENGELTEKTVTLTKQIEEDLSIDAYRGFHANEYWRPASAAKSPDRSPSVFLIRPASHLQSEFPIGRGYRTFFNYFAFQSAQNESAKVYMQ